MFFRLHNQLENRCRAEDIDREVVDIEVVDVKERMILMLMLMGR